MAVEQSKNRKDKRDITLVWHRHLCVQILVLVQVKAVHVTVT